MVKLDELVTKAAQSNSNVLIMGESGSGKEVVARAIHYRSPRSAGPFVAMNCAAVSETLLESELFGHERGAFTGAVAQRRGDFELASGGTLFLDEVGELALTIQAKLLRAIQEKEIKRLGGERPIPVDIRIIAATNRDLETDFRRDLYFRLNVIPIRVPSLRERPGDVAVLARYFVAMYAPQANRTVRGISDEALSALASYHWPGNVRELQNVIENAIVMGSGDTILPADLRIGRAQAAPPQPEAPSTFNYHFHIDAAKRQILAKAFAAAAAQQKHPADLLGVNRTYVYELLKQLKMTDLLKKSRKPKPG